jgi:hypothetical protein
MPHDSTILFLIYQNELEYFSTNMLTTHKEFKMISKLSKISKEMNIRIEEVAKKHLDNSYPNYSNLYANDPRLTYLRILKRLVLAKKTCQFCKKTFASNLTKSMNFVGRCATCFDIMICDECTSNCEEQLYTCMDINICSMCGIMHCVDCASSDYRPCNCSLCEDQSQKNCVLFNL